MKTGKRRYITLSAKVTADLHAAVLAAAKEAGMTSSAFIEMHLDRIVKYSEKQAERMRMLAEEKKNLYKQYDLVYQRYSQSAEHIKKLLEYEGIVTI